MRQTVQGNYEGRGSGKAGKMERKELSLNQKNKGAAIYAIEKPLFVVQGCLEMGGRRGEQGEEDGRRARRGWEEAGNQ